LVDKEGGMEEKYTLVDNLLHFGLCVFLIVITFAWAAFLIFIIKHIWPFLVVLAFVVIAFEMAKIKKGR
jgi:hypothetical protein